MPQGGYCERQKIAEIPNANGAHVACPFVPRGEVCNVSVEDREIDHECLRGKEGDSRGKLQGDPFR